MRTRTPPGIGQYPIASDGAVERGHPLNRGLSGWWLGPSNGISPSGDRVLDLCGRYHGARVNAPAWAPGPPDGFSALEFVSGSSHAATIASAAFDLNRSFAVFGWARKTADTDQPIASASTNNWYLGFRAAGNVCLNRDSAAVVLTSPLGVANNEWHRIGFGIGAGSTAAVQLYLDGVVINSTTTSATYNGSAITARIGRGGSEFFRGRVSDVRVLSGVEPSASLGWADYDQARRGHPDTLRRVRPWSFGVPAAAGNRRRRVLICGGN